MNRRGVSRWRPLQLYSTGLLHESLGHLLRRGHLRSQEAFARVFAGHGISPLQYGILELVLLNPGIRHGEVTEALATAPSVITTAMKPLRHDGLLEQEAPRDGARHGGFRLTDAGEGFFVMVEERLLEAEALLAGPLTTAERRTLRRLLRRLVEGGGL